MQHQGDLGTHGEHRRRTAANLKFEISQQAAGVYAVRCLSLLAFLLLDFFLSFVRVMVRQGCVIVLTGRQLPPGTFYGDLRM